MLIQLRVKNFALIDDSLLEFGRGINVLTGETGAGKSILMEALGFAMGGRLESEWLSAEKSLSVEAVFEIPKRSSVEKALREQGVSSEEEVLTIKREAEAAGKTRSFINGVMATASQVKTIAPFLVDIFGQRDGERLYEPAEQAVLVDSFAGIETEVREFSDLYGRYSKLREEKASLLNSLSQKEREMDLLRYQIKEIESAGIDPEKDSHLREVKVRLSSAEKLGGLFREVYDAVYNGEPSCLELLGRAGRTLAVLAKIDDSSEAARLLKETGDLEVQIGELARMLSKYGESLEYEPGRLDEVMTRIDLLDRLQKKYGGSPEEILRFLAESKTRLTFLESSEENLRQFDADLKSLEKEMMQRSAELTKKRQIAKRAIEKAVAKELESLEMKGAQLEIRIEETDFHSKGKDRVEFYFSANQGSDLKPLAKVASGGEASRIQLALKKCFAETETVSTFIFDEIDSSVGGRLAPVIGEKLHAIAEGHTVIAITHLAPVASQASCHWKACKKTERGQTRIFFQKMEGQDRVEEIAKMLAGKKLTELSLKHAEEILKK